LKSGLIHFGYSHAWTKEDLGKEKAGEKGGGVEKCVSMGSYVKNVRKNGKNTKNRFMNELVVGEGVRGGVEEQFRTGSSKNTTKKKRRGGKWNIGACRQRITWPGGKWKKVF